MKKCVTMDEKYKQKRVYRMQKTMPHDHAGHRQRLMDKVLKDACCEHEYLEMLLCYAIPRRNTNDLAHRLLAEFGSIEHVLAADATQLATVKGIGKSAVTLLKCVHKFFQEYVSTHAQNEALNLPETYELNSFSKYVYQRYKNVKQELLDVFFLDESGKFFQQKSFTSKKEDMVVIDVDALCKLCAALMPSGIVLVHNHPFGDYTPSKMDDQATRNCQYICNLHSVLLCNHFIVAPNGVFDYYTSGKLKKITTDYQLKPLLEQPFEEEKTQEAGGKECEP